MNTSLEPRISTHSRKSTSKSFTEFKSTPVILVCIYNRGNSLITHDFLYQLFSPHGRVLRILIFEKLNVWKAFIEFSNAESAKEAKQSLDDVEIFEDGSKINIYFSTLSCIKFQNKNTGGKDFTTMTENPRQLVKNPIRMNSYDSFDMFLRTEVSKVTLEDSKQPTINVESNLRETDNQQREDEIFNIVNSFKEKIIIDEDEETPDTDPDDLEKDDLSKFFNVFQSDITTPKDFTPSQTYIKASDPFSKPDLHNSPFNYSAISRPFEGSGPLQRLGNPISSLPMSKSISNYNRQFSISRCSTLSEIPDHTNPIRHPLSRMTSFEDVISQPRTLQRHKTSIELNAPSYNMQKSNEGYYNFVNQCPQPLTKFPSSNAIGMINPMTYSPMHNDHQYSKESKTPKSQFSFKHNEENNNPNMMNATKPSVANPFENYDEKKSQVLYVKGLNHPDIKVHMIYNMFSNFGNLLRIIFIRNKAVALLEFENEEYSTVAKEYLNNIVFMGYPLRIYYSNYSVINLSNKRHSTEIEEVFRGTPKTFRFKKNGNVSINPPSSTLHLSNLTKEACTEDFIKEYFQLYGRIESIRFLHIENTKNMCLLKLASVEESVNALAHLHDTNFHGRNIQISFSRSKI